MFVQTGFEPLIEKKIIWKIDHFDYFGGEVKRFVDQEFEVEIDGVGDVPKTKWKFDIRCEFVGTNTQNRNMYGYHDEDDYDYNYGSARQTAHTMTFSYTPLNAGVTRGELGRTFHIVRASVIDSIGKGNWKSFQTELKDLMGPNLDGQPIVIADFFKGSTFADLPVQANGSLMIEINLGICGKKSFDQAGISSTSLGALTIATGGGSPLRVGQFLNLKEHSDVKFIAKDGKEFYAHKIILRAECEVFNAMFRSEMIESQEGVVKLDDISSEGVNFLLHFLYNHDILPFTVDGNTVKGKGKAGESQGGGTEGDKSVDIDVDEVLYIAAKYKLDPVMEFVDNVFRDLCNEQNAMYLFRMGKKYSMNCVNVIEAFIKSKEGIIDQLISKVS